MVLVRKHLLEKLHKNDQDLMFGCMEHLDI